MDDWRVPALPNKCFEPTPQACMLTPEVVEHVLGLGTEKDSLGDIIAYTCDNKGNLVSERTSSDSYHYLFDGLGSVVGLMDINENLVDSYVYDPYGVTEHQTGSQYNPYQFAGGYFDSSTLYYKYGSCYYDCFGWWTQQDPQPSANPYLYANDDPVNEVDPTGRDSIDCGLLIVGEAFVIAVLVTGIALSITTLPVAAVLIGLTGQELGILTTILNVL